MDYYSIPPEEFARHRPWKFHFHRDSAALSRFAAEIMADLIRTNNEAGKPTRLILPTGPLDFRPWADLCNHQKLSLERLVIYLMDEYVDEEGNAISESHPLSFRANLRRAFCERLDPERRFRF